MDRRVRRHRGPAGVNLLFINQYFWPDRAATAQLLGDLAEDTAAAGHDVTALASRSAYALEEGRALPARERWGQVSIRRVWSSNFGRRSALGRVTDYATYLLGAGLRVLFGSRADVVVCLSTPPMVAILGVLARARGTRFVYKVEDLYPDVAVALGTFAEGSLVTAFFRRLSGFLLKRADVCVALDGPMGKVLERRGARRVVVIPNWADGEAIRSDPEAGQRFLSEEGLENRPGVLKVLYSGNLGRAHRFDAVTQAVKTLAAEGVEVEFLFVGAGARLPEVKGALDGLPNVRFLPYQPRERLNDLYNAAELHLVTLRDEVSGLLVPSKYSASLAAGKAVLLVGGSGTDMHREVTERDVGWVCSHEAQEVATAIREAAADVRRVEEMGARGRAVFEERYGRTAATRQWLELLTSPTSS